MTIDAFDMGWQKASEGGYDEDSNPFDRSTQREDWIDWQRGFRSYQDCHDEDSEND